jgi:hypothetical protein
MGVIYAAGATLCMGLFFIKGQGEAPPCFLCSDLKIKDLRYRMAQ